MKKIKSIIIFVLALIFSVGCEDNPPIDLGSIVGTVTDGTIMEPLQGVSVSISPTGKTMTTGSDGKFEFIEIEDGQYTVSVSKENYNSDSKSINVQSGITTADFAITTGNGSIELSKSTLDFGTSDNTLVFDIENIGKSDLTYTIECSEYDWMSVSPKSGTIATTRIEPITITIDRSKIDESKSVTLPISSNAGSTDILVKATYYVATGELSVTPTSLDFGETSSTKSFTVKNEGDADLTFEFLGVEDWFSTTCGSYTLSAGESTSVTVTIDRDKLTESKAHELIVSSNIGNETIAITATYVAKTAELYVSPTSLDFGETSTVKYFTIKNNGAADLTFEFLGVEDWFSATCSNYTLSAGESTSVTVTIDRDKLTESKAHELIVSSNIGNETVALNATYVAKYAELYLTPTTLDFGETSTVKYFTIKNVGTADLTFEFLGVEDWFSTTCGSYTLSAGESTSVTVTIDRDKLTESKAHELIVSSNIGNETVAINATYVAKYAELYLTPTTLDFGETSTVKYFTIKNNGTADLTFEFLGVEDWFSTTCSSYSLSSGESTTVTVTIDRNKVLSATSGTLIVSSNGGSANIALNASVYIPSPTLTLYATEVDFGEDLNTQTFTVYNTGDAAMTFSVNESLSWLSSSYTGSVAAGGSAIVTLTLDRANIYGQVSEDISITSDGGSASITVNAYEPIDYGTAVSPYKDFEISISEAYLTGTTLYIDFLITYTGSSECDQLRIYPASYSGYNTNASDDLGYYYKSSMSLSLGGSYYTNFIEDIQPNTVIRGTIKIQDINSDATKMSSIMLDSYVKYGTSYTYEYIKFSNVPIIR